MTRFLLCLAIVFSATAAQAGELRPFGKGSWQELKQLHAGRPAIVHFWGLTCGPCLTELPQWGKFASDAGVDLVMVAADPVPEPAPSLLATLAKARLDHTEAWVFADPYTERLEYEIDPDWRGELPLTVLLGRNGSTESVLGTTDFAQLRNWTQSQTRP